MSPKAFVVRVREVKLRINKNVAVSKFANAIGCPKKLFVAQISRTQYDGTASPFGDKLFAVLYHAPSELQI
jgi:hypothetical protein